MLRAGVVICICLLSTASAVAAQGWSGAYAGLTAGYGVGRADTPTGLGDDATIDSYGWDYGPFVGYRSEVGRGVVLGLELGYLWSTADGFADFGSNANVSGAWGALDKRSEAYLSLHAGRQVRPEWLVYGIAGVQSARFDFDHGTDDFGQTVEEEATTGGWHAGLGVARRLDQAAARLEYRYQRYDGIDWGCCSSVEPRENVVRLSLSFALPPVAR
jgi:opacity protein-like surface antigen